MSACCTIQAYGSDVQEMVHSSTNPDYMAVQTLQSTHLINCDMVSSKYRIRDFARTFLACLMNKQFPRKYLIRQAKIPMKVLIGVVS